MDSLKIIRSALILAVGAALSVACAPTPVAHDERVPLQLVPTGYTQEECKYDDSQQLQQGKTDGAENSGGFGGSSTSAMAQADVGGRRSTRPFHCKHTVAETSKRCFGDDGKEHPLQWCLDKASADTKP